MNRNVFAMILAAACLAVPAAAQSAQEAQAGAEPSDAPILRVNVNEVNLIFTVTDKHGHYIANLQQSDFALLDDQLE